MLGFLRRLVSNPDAEEANDEQSEHIEVETRKRIAGCLLGLAVGDAKGMPAESKSVSHGDVVADTFEYMDGYLPAGSYTDDTHHAIFLAESLIEKGDFDPNDFMSKLSKMDMGRGYGPTTLKAMIRYVETKDYRKSGFPSPGNGPSMRIAPLATAYHNDKDQLRAYAKESAKTTHTHPEAIGGAMSVAFSVAYMLNNYQEEFDKEGFQKELIEFVEPECPELAEALKEDAVLMDRYGCRVLETVPHAIRAFLNNPHDYEKAVTEAIRGGGDTDTIAAITGAISGALNGIDSIPKLWIENLENGEKGREYIESLAYKLHELSKNRKGGKTK